MRAGRVRRSVVVGALAFVAVLSGCATAAKAVFTQPDVTFRGVGVRSIGLDGADLEVLLNIYNLQRLGPQLLRGGEIPYRVMGDVTLQSFVGTFSRQFSEAGRFDASRTFRQ